MTLPTYQYSGVCYVATAGQTTFALTTSGGNAINCARPDHIKVRTSADSGNTWTDLSLGTDWLFADPPVSIVLSTGVDVGIAVDIHRQTPLSQDFIKFEDGSLLTAGQLNDFDDWQLYIDQEIADRVENLTAPDINLADTDDLPEGSVNLYYTDAKVESYVSGAGYIKDAGVTKIIAGNSNIQISPSSGTGEVTISATGGGGTGGIPEAPTDGQVYGRRGSDTSWIQVTGSGTPNLQAVTTQGNDSTNDITLNTDKIVLTASSGSATFAGKIQMAGLRIDELTAITSTSP